MSEISNCLLSGYDVLPSEPRNFQFSNVGTNIGILHWDSPKTHVDTIGKSSNFEKLLRVYWQSFIVDGYKVTFTRIKAGGDNLAQVEFAPKSPYILEHLEPDSSYEVYVQARNFYGLGDPTTRIVFR